METEAPVNQIDTGSTTATLEHGRVVIRHKTDSHVIAVVSPSLFKEITGKDIYTEIAKEKTPKTT